MRLFFRLIVIVGFVAAIHGLTTVVVGADVTTWTRLGGCFALLFLVFHTRPIFFREAQPEREKAVQPPEPPPRMAWTSPAPIRQEVWRVVDRTGKATNRITHPALVVDTTIIDGSTPERRSNNVTSAR